MEHRTAYRYLADWFEYLNDDCDYEKWSQYLITELKAFPLKKGLDVGCGSGYFTRAFYRAGFEMTGLDISGEMLAKAEELSLKEGVKIPFLLGDIVAFSSPQKYDFVTAVNDCFNYVPQNKILSAFKKVKGVLRAGGVFLFDISSKRKFQEKIANTVSVDDREDITYLSFNSLRENQAVMDVSLFIKDRDGKYERKDERHVQYVYTVDEIEDNLKKAGFTILKTFGHFGEDIEKSDRIVFLARKGERV